MKGLKKIALASAIAAVSAGAQAELKALDDSAMGELTGQAGLTIDLETKYTIGEFMYKDAGSVFLKGISLGGSTKQSEVDIRTLGATGPAAATLDSGLVDNIRIKLDIAGAGDTDPANGVADNSLDTGFSRVRLLAGIVAAAGPTNAEVAKFANAAQSGEASLGDLQDAGIIEDSVEVTAANTATQTIEDKKTYGDGDLLIHVSFKDAFQKSGIVGGAQNIGLAGQLAAGTLGALTFEDALDSGLKSVDFNFSIDAIGLAASTIDAGDTIVRTLDGHTASGTDTDGVDTTVLISDLSINGYLGPMDIHIENKGNGFSKLAGFADAQAAADALALAADDGVVTDAEKAAAFAAGGAQFLNGVGDADSKINWNTYVKVTDLDVYLDIAGVQITDLKINNVRGDVTDLNGNFAFGFAQSKREIYAVRNTAGLNSGKILAGIANGDTYTGVQDVIEQLGDDGVAINTVFKGDMEIGALSFGDTGTSIGKLYWTDIESTTNWTISAH